MRDLLGSAGLSFLVALVATPIVRDIFHAYNVVDRPGFRKVHAHPIPRLGGVSVGLAYILTLILSANREPDPESVLWAILPGALVILLTGVLDDFNDLRPLYKLAGQIAAGALAYFNGIRLETLFGVSLPWPVSLAFTIMWFLLLINALNLIDGLDGLCAGMGLVAAGGFYIAARMQGQTALQEIELPLLGALAGFLCYNFSRATMFLGDSGALLIGYLVGAAGIMLANKGLPNSSEPVHWASMLVPAMITAVPLGDVFLSITRRYLVNRRIFGADRGHIHHRLLDSGLSRRRAVLTLYLYAVIGALLGLLMMVPSLDGWQWPILIIFLVLLALAVWTLRYPEFTMAHKLLFGGDFRKIMEAKDRIRNFGKEVERADSKDDVWNLLVDFGRDAGWTEIVWAEGAGVWKRQAYESQDSSTWTFQVSLPGVDAAHVSISGNHSSSAPPLDLPEFAETLSCALAKQPRQRSGQV